MARLSIPPLRDGLAGLKLVVDRRRITGGGALARRSSSVPQVLAALTVAGLIPREDWVAHEARWSATGVVIVPVGPRNGLAQLIVKLPASRPALDSLEAQGISLASLHANPRLRDWLPLVPRVVQAGSVGDLPYFVETALAGRSANELFRDADARRRLLPAAAEAIAELHRQTATTVVVDEGAADAWTERPALAVAAVLPRRDGGGGALHTTLAALTGELRTGLLGHPVSVGWIHGDYWPGNILASPDGTRITGIIDWDLAADGQLALHDPVHLIMIGRSLVSGRDLGDVVLSLLAGDPLEPAEVSALAASGIEPSAWSRDRRQLVLLAWLRHVGVFAQMPGDGTNPRWVRRNVSAVLSALSRPG